MNIDEALPAPGSMFAVVQTTTIPANACAAGYDDHYGASPRWFYFCAGDVFFVFATLDRYIGISAGHNLIWLELNQLYHVTIGRSPQTRLEPRGYQLPWWDCV